MTQPVSSVTAVLPKDTVYTVNDSDVKVVDGRPSLLVDEIVSTDNSASGSDYRGVLVDKAVKLVGEGFQNVATQAKYLDLVDAANGNTWIQTDSNVTIYWPYPQGTDANTKFRLVHFDGLDREMTADEVMDAINKNEPVVVKDLVTDQYGIRFETDSFSPFVLVWDNTQTTTPEGETFEQYTRRFLAELDREIRDQKAVGLKSCAAYSEGGLDVRPVEGGEAGQAYDRLRAGSARAGDERILRSWLLMESLQAAEEKDLPVQFHTGHGGGSWIDFPTMNPLCLVELLKDRRVMNRVRIVLLHGGHPHEEDTSYLTAQFANVYTDFSGAFYLSSLKGVERMAALLERAPLDKVMYGSDGVMFPEISWFAHGRFRVQLTRLLNRMIEEGCLTEPRARQVARMICFDNALDCYPALRQRVGAV